MFTIYQQPNGLYRIEQDGDRPVTVHSDLSLEYALMQRNRLERELGKGDADAD